jgi:hypothetical protein
MLNSLDKSILQSKIKNRKWLDVARHLERLAFGGPLGIAAADALHANSLPFDRAVDFHLNALEVGLESPAADAGDLAADAAEVLGLAATGVMIAPDGLLSTNGTLHSHTTHPFPLAAPIESGSLANTENV